MTFHVDYETPTPPARSTWRSPKVVALAVTIALVAGLAYYLGTRNTATPTTPSGAGAGTIAPPTNAGTGPDTSAGLPRGEARAGTGGRRTIYDMPVGYTRDQTGAIQAATNYTTAQLSNAMLVTQSRHEIYDYMFSQNAVRKGVSDAQAREQNLRHGINDAGQAVDPQTGEVNPQLAAYYNCYPVYGAYNVLAYSTTTAKVRVWAPCILGVASDDDTSELRVDWLLNTIEITWERDDWRVRDQKSLTGAAPAVVRSWRDVNVPYKERARLIQDPKMFPGEGSGWTLYANATEAPLPYLGGQP